MKRVPYVTLAVLLLQSPVAAQNIARSVAASEGLVQVVFPARANICGDGVSYIQTMNGRSNRTYVGSSTFNGRDGWRDRACSPGPARVLASVEAGQVTRLSVFVGPVPSNDTRTINTSAPDAVAWLAELAQRGVSKVASTAIEALTFADAPTPWPTILRIARDTDRPRDVRRHATTWLSFGVTEKLGLADVDDHRTDDDELRTQAVFVLSQRPKSESVPELIDLAKTAKNATVRKSAIFWLGQSGDPRAVDVYAELLGLR
jgi:HEAT repeat protein